MTSVFVPSSEKELDSVRALFRDFVRWHRSSHKNDTALIDEYFDKVAFENELKNLPGDYTPPHGQLLLATVDNVAAGCVALRRLDRNSSEMKRMYVLESFRNQGVGRSLGTAILKESKTLGYKKIFLDTSIHQVEAQRLYKSLGFRGIDPYYELAANLQNWLIFMSFEF